jgi:carbon monoxide dehydrogenase subunit G
VTRIVAVVEVGAPADAVWARLTDWPAHGRWIPFTTVRTLTARSEGVGTRFLGRTAIGPFGFDDPMEVTDWHPPVEGRPGRCAVRKLGSTVMGTAAFDVAPVDDRRTLVVWEEDIEARPVRLTRSLAPLVTWLGRRALTGSLRSMGRELEADRRVGAPRGIPGEEPGGR